MRFPKICSLAILMLSIIFSSFKKVGDSFLFYLYLMVPNGVSGGLASLYRFVTENSDLPKGNDDLAKRGRRS